MILRALTLFAVLILPGLAEDLPFTHTRTGGPQSLVIEYRCNPDARPALRKIMAEKGAGRFEAWRQQGVLHDYHLLFNSYLDSETYDMLAILNFANADGIRKWREIEKEFPGGLAPEALKLVNAAVTYPVDQARHGAASETETGGRANGVWFVIPYDYAVSTDEYVRYLDSYVIPQVKGWMNAGVVTGYSMFIGRYSTGRPWSSLLVLKYRDSDAFGKREATVVQTREKLTSDPVWRAASENKQKIRVEKQTIIAEEIPAVR